MLRKIAGVTGELLITFGVIALFYVVYSLWFTNAVAEANSAALRDRFQTLLENEQNPNLKPARPAPVVPEGPQPNGDFVEPTRPDVDPFGLLYIPRLASDVWAEPLVSGVTTEALASGVGHYPSTELPGEEGNFAIAGHRATNGEPFARFERLTVGDRVFVQTYDGWFEYELVRDKIVQEDEVWVLADNPLDQGFEPGDKLITLTTCDPRWNSYQRWVWWGELVAEYPVDEIPTEIAEGS